jgi:hypothetical protein
MQYEIAALLASFKTGQTQRERERSAGGTRSVQLN